MDADKEEEITRQYIEMMDTKTPSQEQLIGNLSGGNQQKVMIGRWLATAPKILILDEQMCIRDRRIRPIPLFWRLRDWTGFFFTIRAAMIPLATQTWTLGKWGKRRIFILVILQSCAGSIWMTGRNW